MGKNRAQKAAFRIPPKTVKEDGGGHRGLKIRPIFLLVIFLLLIVGGAFVAFKMGVLKMPAHILGKNEPQPEYSFEPQVVGQATPTPVNPTPAPTVNPGNTGDQGLGKDKTVSEPWSVKVVRFLRNIFEPLNKFLTQVDEGAEKIKFPIIGIPLSFVVKVVFWILAVFLVAHISLYWLVPGFVNKITAGGRYINSRAPDWPKLLICIGILIASVIGLWNIFRFGIVSGISTMTNTVVPVGTIGGVMLLFKSATGKIQKFTEATALLVNSIVEWIQAFLSIVLSLLPLGGATSIAVYQLLSTRFSIQALGLKPSGFVASSLTKLSSWGGLLSGGNSQIAWFLAAALLVVGILIIREGSPSSGRGRGGRGMGNFDNQTGEPLG